MLHPLESILSSAEAPRVSAVFLGRLNGPNASISEHLHPEKKNVCLVRWTGKRVGGSFSEKKESKATS